MVKPKQRHMNSAPENNSSTGWNVDESWIIVKKQKVTILIPPLPSGTKSTMPDLGQSQLQAVSRNTLNKLSQRSNDAHPIEHLLDEQEKSMSLARNRGIQIARRTPHQSIPPIARPAMIDSRTEPENQDRVPASKPYNKLGVSDRSRTIECPRSKHGISGSLDRSVLLNQRLRALNLQRKLQKAGGLSRWLSSLGLGQFIRLFQRKSVNKFQLVNITMKKLKDMGADAVGPRRKLVHAIECVCQPCCFEAL